MAKRKTRSFRATDAEWEEICSRAAAADMQPSAFLRAQALESRAIRASDREWALVAARAAAAGMTVDAFVLQRTLEPAAGREPVVAVPLGLLRRLALDVRALAISDSWRYGDEAAGNDWEAILDQAERTLAAEPDAT